MENLKNELRDLRNKEEELENTQDWSGQKAFDKHMKKFLNKSVKTWKVEHFEDDELFFPKEPGYHVVEPFITGLQYSQVSEETRKNFHELLDKYGINKEVLPGRTMLNLAALNDDLGMIKYLLNAGADSKIKDNFGRLPIHLTCNLTITKLLLEADPTIINDTYSKFAYTALFRALDSKKFQTAEYLLERGADPNLKVEDKYLWEYFEGNEKILKMIEPFVELEFKKFCKVKEFLLDDLKDSEELADEAYRKFLEKCEITADESIFEEENSDDSSLEDDSSNEDEEESDR